MWVTNLAKPKTVRKATVARVGMKDVLRPADRRRAKVCHPPTPMTDYMLSSGDEMGDIREYHPPERTGLQVGDAPRRRVRLYRRRRESKSRSKKAVCGCFTISEMANTLKRLSAEQLKPSESCER